MIEVKAKIKIDDGGIPHYILKCPYCNKQHMHGVMFGDGESRLSHCKDKKKMKDYIIRTNDPVAPDNYIKAIKRLAES